MLIGYGISEDIMSPSLMHNIIRSPNASHSQPESVNRIATSAAWSPLISSQLSTSSLTFVGDTSPPPRMRHKGINKRYEDNSIMDSNNNNNNNNISNSLYANSQSLLMSPTNLVAPGPQAYYNSILSSSPNASLYNSKLSILHGSDEDINESNGSQTSSNNSHVSYKQASITAKQPNNPTKIRPTNQFPTTNEHNKTPHYDRTPGARILEMAKNNPHQDSALSVFCNCKKSRCLKLYCDCFRIVKYCDGCNCNDCANTSGYDHVRVQAMNAILERNSEAFKPRVSENPSSSGKGHLNGCHCKKSACLKKYCECFSGSAPCTDKCRCNDCKNLASIYKDGVIVLSAIPAFVSPKFTQSVYSIDTTNRSSIGTASAPVVTAGSLLELAGICEQQEATESLLALSPNPKGLSKSPISQGSDAAADGVSTALFHGKDE